MHSANADFFFDAAFCGIKRPKPWKRDSLSGFAIKGPIDGAVAFVDVNDDGLLQDDEPYAFTEADGSFTIDTDGETGDLIVTTDNAVVAAAELSISAVDTSSSTSLSNVTLSAPTGATVVSPTSTLINESSFLKHKLKKHWV